VVVSVQIHKTQRDTYCANVLKCLVAIADIPPATARCSLMKTTRLCTYDLTSELILTSATRAVSCVMSCTCQHVTSSPGSCRTSDENKAACDSRFPCFSKGVCTTEDVEASSAFTISLAARSSMFGNPSSSLCLCEMKNWSFWSGQQNSTPGWTIDANQMHRQTRCPTSIQRNEKKRFRSRMHRRSRKIALSSH
jgi:hypothetical protein